MKNTFESLFGQSTKMFAVNTIVVWLIAMGLNYLVMGASALNAGTALGSLAAPAVWLVVSAGRSMFKK